MYRAPGTLERGRATVPPCLVARSEDHCWRRANLPTLHRYTQVIKPGLCFTPIARSIESRRCPRRYGFIDVFLLRGVHAHQRFDCFDDPLGVANDIAVDLLRR
jgi:hypothetical protein